MADKLIIEVYKNKNAEDFTKALAEPDSRLNVGSAAAYTAACAAALLSRAAAMTASETSGERVDYIVRNSETLRAYMVHLIDEDVKCRGPLAKATKAGDPRKIEAARQPAAAIASEIVNMMGQCLGLMKELCELCPAGAVQFIGEGAELALASVKSCMIYMVALADKCADETYRFVTRRENEITLAECTETYKAIAEKVKAGI